MSASRIARLSFVLLPAVGAALQVSSVFDIQTTPNVSSQGNMLSASTALSATDVWAVGFSGNSNNFNEARTLTEHFDGSRWSVVPSPNSNPGRCRNPGFSLNAVAAAASNDVWAVGFRNQNDTCTSQLKPLIEHWNGASWQTVTSPNLSDGGNNALNGVVAFAPNNAYAVGYQDGPMGAVQTLVEHWNGTAWSVMPSPNANNTGNVLTAVTAASPTDIWAVGDQVAPDVAVLTLAEHFDGTAWSVVPTPNVVTSFDLDQNVLTAVKALAPNNVIAVGYILDFNAQRTLTLIEQWNGSSWSVIPSPNQSTASGSLNKLTAVAALSPTNIYAFGYFSNGSTGGQTFTLGMHYNGVNWTLIDLPRKGRAQQLFGAAALPSANMLWATGGYSIPGINFEFGFLQLPKTLALFNPAP